MCTKINLIDWLNNHIIIRLELLSFPKLSVNSSYKGYRGSKAGTKPVKTYRSKVIKNVRHNAKKYIKKHIVKPIKKFWRKLWR